MIFFLVMKSYIVGFRNKIYLAFYQNMEIQLSLIADATKNGNFKRRADAANHLALLSETEAEMLAWATLAADFGHETAQVSLGIMYESSDPLFAEQMYLKAIRSSGEAQYRYGLILLKRKSFLKGIWHLQEAAKNGYKEPLDKLMTLPQHLFPVFNQKEIVMALTKNSFNECKVLSKQKNNYSVCRLDTKEQFTVEYYLLQKMVTWL